MNKKLNSRQLKSQNTRDKIYNIAIKLMESKGFDNITVSEICQAAGVSVGSFYNHFESKHDIISEDFKLADDYFLNTIALNIKGNTSPEKIKDFFHYYAEYNQDSGLDFMKQLYTGKNNLFTTKGRHMQTVLQAIVQSGQDSGELSLDMNPEEIVRYLFVSVRGVVYDWCLHDGKYDLINTIDKHVNLLVQAL